MLIGIDFDNTIAGYDHVFPAAAAAENLLDENSASSKLEVREILQQQPGGEQNWMRLQGQVYGKYMPQAHLIKGVAEFILHCKATSTPLCIISHKTEFGHYDLGKINLRDAALDWMKNQGFFKPEGFAFSRSDIYFEATRKEKVARIGQLGCTHFIDDLEEVFAEPGFPANAKKYLIAPNASHQSENVLRSFRTWAEISDDIFSD